MPLHATLLLLLIVLQGCAKTSPSDMTQTSGHGAAGSAAGSGTGGGGSGGGGSGGGGSGGSAGDACPKDLALPAICRVCADGSCGVPVCKDGKFSDYRCANDLPDAGMPSGLHWYMTCGAPVCRGDEPFDDPSIPNCTTQKLGDPCTKADEQCDGVFSCGARLICAASDPTQRPGGCPISRARFKERVEYLTSEERRGYRDQLLALPLAAYRYKHAPEAGPQLGFMIDDIEPSVAVSGDHVNMYGYLSMAVAAIQEQQSQIRELQRELARVRAELGSRPETQSCEP